MKRKHVVLLVFVVAIIVFYLYPIPKHSFKELYKGSAKDVAEDLYKLRSLPLKSIVIDGVERNYLATGQGRDCSNSFFQDICAW